MTQARFSVPDARLLGAISAGGVLGALARYGAGFAFPHGAGDFGWATFGVNTLGCLLIGIVVAGVTSAEWAGRLARPFLVTGVLGGFTTFSTYIVDVQRALVAGAPRTALIYAAATLAAALAAALAGVRIGEAGFARVAVPATVGARAASPAAAEPPEDACGSGADGAAAGENADEGEVA
jgi:CrcB protein